MNGNLYIKKEYSKNAYNSKFGGFWKNGCGKVLSPENCLHTVNRTGIGSNGRAVALHVSSSGSMPATKFIYIYTKFCLNFLKGTPDGAHFVLFIL